MPDHFEYRHVVTLDETNQLGNVYFAHFLRWQGHCRELFLRATAPEVVSSLDHEHALVTVRAQCDYLDELYSFDEVGVRMHVRDVVQNRMTLAFEYWRVTGQEALVARGEQQLAWLRRTDDGFEPVPVPPALLRAIDAYLDAPVRTGWRARPGPAYNQRSATNEEQT
ncbi:acyl-CoA thioesterase [Nocardiopsis alba]|uniref:acyl-CoA thioesterase n=1 Tax=Nocardiopsis alba TaxID=53437 RepID=UPI00366B229D